MLYDGGRVETVSGGEGFRQLACLQINHQGQIMWLGLKEGSEYDIYLYNKGVTRKITNYENCTPGTLDIWQNSLTDVKTKFSPQLNNKGDIVWVTRVPPRYQSLRGECRLSHASQFSALPTRCRSLFKMG
jgi:hypothetical protein